VEVIMKILVTPTSFTKNKRTKAMDMLTAFTEDIVFNDLGRPLEAAEIIERLDGVDGYIAGLDYITAEAINAAPASLKVISRYGAGCDRVDTQAAKSKGIAVTSTPGANAQAVADLALGLMLSVARKIPYLDKKTKEGGWVRSTGQELYKKTLGIVGLGAIGKNVAKRAAGFSMDILAYDPYGDANYMAQNNIKNVSLEYLLQNSDFVSLHLPINNETRHIVDASALATVRQGAIIINTSRGGLIDEAAAYEALVSGRLGGLGLDAFEQEPPVLTAPLFTLDNVVTTPHTGAHTFEATEGMGVMAVQNLIDVLSGGSCPYIVNR
jgi:D-3-phosphoglycerate dehydrogenase